MGELEAYIDDIPTTEENDKEEPEVEDEEEESTIYEDILFEGVSLADWEKQFTVMLPAIPCTSNEILQSMVNLNNQYQIAFNCYNRLIIMTSRAEKRFKSELFRLMSEKIVSLKAALPAGKTGKLPAKDTIESIVLGESKLLSELLKKYKVYDKVKEIFENHKTKLEKSMIMAKDISYSVNASNKVYGLEGGKGHGIS